MITTRWKEHFRQVPSFRCVPWADPDGGQGVRTPLKNHKNIGFPSNIDPDSLKSQSYIKPGFNGGPLSTRQENAISMAFRWWADDGPFLVALRIVLDPRMHAVRMNRLDWNCTVDGHNFIFWYLQHATKTQTSLRKCAFSIQHWWLRYVKHHRFCVEWINFVSFDSNHNLEKGPFVYKFV